MLSPTTTDPVPATANSSPTGFDAIDEQGSETSLERIFEPPSGFVLTAIGRNKLLVCVCALVLALLTAVFAHGRARTYTASTTLQVGQVNPNSPGFYSYVSSAAALATAFSRAIVAEPVLAEIQHKLKLAPATAAARLSAEPLPLSPAFRIFATGPTAASAISLANVASSAVVSYVSQSNSANPEAESLLQEYRKVSLEVQNATNNVARQAYFHRTPRGSTPPFSNALASVRAERETAVAKLAAIRAAYTSAVSSQAPRNGLVSLIAGASTAGSNRKSKVELFGFIGLLAGVAIGCAAAVMCERLRRRSAHAVAVELGAPHETPRSTEAV